MNMKYFIIDGELKLEIPFKGSYKTWTVPEDGSVNGRLGQFHKGDKHSTQLWWIDLHALKEGYKMTWDVLFEILNQKEVGSKNKERVLDMLSKRNIYQYNMIGFD